MGVPDRRYRRTGADAASPGGAPPRLRRPGRGQHREQHGRARAHLQRRDRPGRRGRVHGSQRHGADPPAGPGRHNGHVRQPGRQRQRPRRDTVLRGPVRRPAQARRVVHLHVQPARRVLLQRQLQPPTHRKDRGVLTRHNPVHGTCGPLYGLREAFELASPRAAPRRNRRMQERPLDGIRVLDLTNVLAGPYCSYQLMLLGAEVVKVELPGQGDAARRLGPDPELNRADLGASFLAQNAGKKSVELDLKNPDDRSTFKDMVQGADVLLENFRAGVLARLGFDWPRLQEINPRLVYCAISGFGQTGPMSQAPAYDQIIQGLSGMMSITGTPDTAPLRVGFPICDTAGGLVAALAICAALVGRTRTGEGCALDVSMLEASMSAMGWAVSNYLISGVEPRPMGDQNVTAAPSGTFETADGPVNIAATRQSQFETLCRLIGRPELLTDLRFSDREAR